MIVLLVFLAFAVDQSTTGPSCQEDSGDNNNDAALCSSRSECWIGGFPFVVLSWLSLDDIDGSRVVGRCFVKMLEKMTSKFDFL